VTKFQIKRLQTGSMEHQSTRNRAFRGSTNKLLNYETINFAQVNICLGDPRKNIFWLSLESRAAMSNRPKCTTGPKVKSLS